MRHIILAIAILICTASDAQIIRAEPFYTAPEAAAVGDSFLNTYTGARVAYSLRLLNKNYSGNCIRVRRHSDNAEQNIGFINGYLDTAAIISFAQSDTAFVVTLYDQSGNTNNATQSTAINQARIYIDSVFEKSSGIIAIRFDSSNDGYSFGNPSIFADSSHTILYVYERLTAPAGERILISITNSNTNRLAISNIGQYTLRTSVTTGKSISTAINTRYLVFAVNSPQELYYNNNQSTGTLSATVPAGTNLFFISAPGQVTNATPMLFHECVLYNTNRNAERSGMQSNINSFYSIY